MGFWIYPIIFFGKILEVSLATLRIVLINRGEKIKGALIGFIEVLIWIYLIGNMISTITEDLLKVVVYCLAFSCGNYIGVTLEEKLAIGNACIWTVVGNEQRENLEHALRDRGFGVTISVGEGLKDNVHIFMIYLKRKQITEATDVIHSFIPKAFITVNDVRQLTRGTIKK